MRILVTGGYGFIGSNFIEYIIKKEEVEQVINIDNMSYGSHPDNLKEIEGNKKYIFYKEDIRNYDKIKEIIINHQPDIIINFAAESHVDRSIKDPLPFFTTNIIGVVNLLEIIRKFDDNAKFVQIGTDEEYGEIFEGSFNEDDRLKPSSPYSSSKASASLITLSYYRTYSLNVNVTRSSNNYGPKQFPEKLIPKTIIRAYLNLSIPIYGSGKQVRDWLYVLDNCEGIYTVAIKGKPGEIYNISANQEKTNIEIVKTILKLMNKPESLIKFVEDRPGHDFRYSLSSEKLRNLGWKPKYSLEEGLKLTVDWYLKNEWWWRKILREDIIAETPWKN